jgi:hypothetical protein
MAHMTLWVKISHHTSTGNLFGRCSWICRFSLKYWALFLLLCTMSVCQFCKYLLDLEFVAVNGGQSTRRKAVRNGQQYKDVVCLPLPYCLPLARYASSFCRCCKTFFKLMSALLRKFFCAHSQQYWPHAIWWNGAYMRDQHSIISHVEDPTWRKVPC